MSIGKMTLRDSLLRSILEDPDDDSLRLIFADFLNETGIREDDAFADFIRIQFAPNNGGGLERLRISRSLFNLFSQSYTMGAFAVNCPKWAKWFEYRRGFLFAICCDSRNVYDNLVFIMNNPICKIYFSDMSRYSIHLGNKPSCEARPWFIKCEDRYHEQNWDLPFADRTSAYEYIPTAILRLWVMTGHIGKG